MLSLNQYVNFAGDELTLCFGNYNILLLLHTRYCLFWLMDINACIILFKYLSA